MGPRRARRMGPRLVQPLSANAGRGDLGRTPSAMSKIFARFRRWHRARVSAIQVGKGLKKRALALWKRQRSFFCKLHTKQLSMSLDGTRMGKKDVLFAVLWSPDKAVGVWCPPQALQGVVGNSVFVRVPCRKMPALAGNRRRSMETAHYCIVQCPAGAHSAKECVFDPVLFSTKGHG